MKQTLRKYCETHGFENLLKEWDYEKNAPLTPDNVAPKSNKKVWWTCPKDHTYQASIGHRTINKSGCPYCSGRKAIAGYTDLATIRPDVAAEWHSTLNGDLKPDMVTHKSAVKAWWLCPEGHAYQASIVSRTNMNSGCPYCAGKKVIVGVNDLQTLYPEIAKEWHPTLNGDLTPDRVQAHSNKFAWWLCDKGHAYKARIGHRTSSRHRGCPYCANKKLLPGFNDLATRYPEIAKQWHPTLNGDLTPDQVLPGINKKVWWQCSEGHVWQARLNNRTGPNKTGCPYCAGKRKISKMAEVIEQDDKIMEKKLLEKKQ